MKKSNYLILGFVILIIFITPFVRFNLITKVDSSIRSTIESKNQTQFVDKKISNIDNLYYFIENKGQFSEELKYYSNYNKLTIGFLNSKVKFLTSNSEFQITFQGSNDVSPKSIDCLVSVSNYYTNEVFISNAHHYKQIIFENLYDGISLIYKYTPLGLKYDFLVDPFANIEQIAIIYEGLDELQINTNSLELCVGDSIIYDDELKAWYERTKEPIDIEFNKKVNSFSNNKIVSFSVKENYDKSQRIIIDPLICTFSTFYGGSNVEHAVTAGDHGECDLFVDDEGYIYYTGQSFSSDFGTTNPFQNLLDQNILPGGGGDVSLLKMTPDGQSIVFATLIGGTDWDVGTSVNVDSFGNIILLGVTFSLDFPILNAYQEIHGGDENYKDVFIARFNSTGGLLSSTYFGGSAHDYPYGVAIDENDNIIYCGGSSSTDFFTKNAYQSVLNGSSDITLTKFSSDCQSVLFSTLYGGSSNDFAMDVVLDSTGNIMLTGMVVGDDFPTVNGYQSHITGGFGSFLLKFSSSGSLIFATTIDGALYDKGMGVTVDAQDNIVVAGGTVSIDFPLVNATQTTIGGNEDIFVSKFSADGQELLFSTFIGGGGGEEGQDIKIDSEGNIIVVGLTTSPNFPIKNAFQETYLGEYDACIAIIAPNGTLLSSSFLGGDLMDKAIGVAMNADDSFIVGGWTLSTNFPTKDPYQSSLKGVNDIFIAKFYLDPTPITPTTTPTTSPTTSAGLVFGMQTMFLLISLIGGCIIIRKKH
ncbi:MAG: hypothetical protein FK734_10410 [Asgard group archaeon]|nr:hypothetical protein [Asgard group archaeon]